ncbi:ATP-dependent RecD-like DNA helicase [Paenarthrobacter sp. NPDC056912]|uniref:ATP-dependent DNA helicase n=1 Tax=Paenarthrobacter sp. NPDC056912 TaxID=3345965 RepID=UPI00366B7BF5
MAAPPERFHTDHVDRLTAQVLATVSNSKASFTHWNLRAEAERATRHYRFASQPERDRTISTITETALGRSVLLTPAPITEAPGHSFRPHRGAKYTTQRTLDAEARLLTASTLTTAPTVKADRAHAIARATTTKSGHHLSSNQATAVVAVTTSGRTLDLLVGPAGAGKSTTMSAMRAVWESQHGPGSVIGLAPSQRAAKILSDEINAPTANTAKWLYETVGEGGLKRERRIAAAKLALERCGSAEARDTLKRRYAKLFAEDLKWSVTAGQLVIVDESSLAGTHTLDQLRSQVQKARAKLLLVGDHHQLQAVETGGAFGMLVRARPDTPELTEVRRFQNPWEAAATLKIRTGDHTVTNTYSAQGRLHGGNLEEMLDAAYVAWLADTAAGKNSLLIAPDNDTVRELNERARAHKVENGDVSAGKSVALRDGTHASRGDIVVSRLNDNTNTDAAGEAVSNRDQWVVEKVHNSGALTLRRIDPEAPESMTGARVRVDKDYAAKDMELGYATTGHGAQGLTVDTAHGVAIRSSTRELLYVISSRAREENHLYLVTGDETPYSIEAAITTPEEVFNHILTAAGAERSATEQARDEHTKWLGFDQIRDEYTTLSHSADQPQWEKLINDSPLTDEQKHTVLNSEAWPSLAQSFRQATTTTGNLNAVLPRLITYREIDSAADPAKVLHYRVDAWTKRQTTDPAKLIPGTTIPRTTSTDPAINAALTAREQHLATFAAENPTPERVTPANTQPRSGPQSAHHITADQETAFWDEQQQPHWIREEEFTRTLAADQDHGGHGMLPDSNNPAAPQTPDRPLNTQTHTLPESAFPDEQELATYQQENAHHGY